MGIVKTFWSPIESLGMATLRHGASAVAGYLAFHGMIRGDQASAFVGSVFFLGSLAFSFVDKYMVHGKISDLAAAATAAQNDPVVAQEVKAAS